jgi:hypothetical protein
MGGDQWMNYMQTIATSMILVGCSGALRVAWLAQYYGNMSEPSRNRTTIFSAFFPCIAIVGIWLLRRISSTMMIVGWVAVVLPALTLGILKLAPAATHVFEDEQFRVGFSNIALPSIFLAGCWAMWRRSKQPAKSQILSSQ